MAGVGAWWDDDLIDKSGLLASVWGSWALFGKIPVSMELRYEFHYEHISKLCESSHLSLAGSPFLGVVALCMQGSKNSTLTCLLYDPPSSSTDLVGDH